MGQFSVEKPVAPGSALSGNQQLAQHKGRYVTLNGMKQEVIISESKALAVAARGSEACGRPVEIRPFQDLPE